MLKKFKKNLLEQIKGYRRKRIKITSLNHANYDIENKELTNVSSHCHLKEFDFPINYI